MRLQQTKKLMFSIGNHQRQKEKEKKKEKGNRLFTSQIYDKMLISKI